MREQERSGREEARKEQIRKEKEKGKKADRRKKKKQRQRKGAKGRKIEDGGGITQEVRWLKARKITLFCE